ncbi:unnamed protein product, partial [Ectocarpus sp. 12 AP-2014]
VLALLSQEPIYPHQHGIHQQQQQQQQQSRVLGEECRRLRRLQTFRKRNACALISLPRSSSGKDREGEVPPSDTPCERPQQQQRRQQQENLSATATKNVTTSYRLRHLTCSLRPTVSCHQLDYTRIGHPSDTPPFVTDNELQKAGVASGRAQDMLHLRLVIPNIAPTSIRCADHHRSCMAHTSEQG